MSTILKEKLMLKMYAIRDRESQTFSPMPLGFTTNRDAIEAFKELVNDPKTTISKHPTDFQLIEIGAYDPREGQLTSINHESVAWANELLKPTEEA